MRCAALALPKFRAVLAEKLQVQRGRRRSLANSAACWSVSDAASGAAVYCSMVAESSVFVRSIQKSPGFDYRVTQNTDLAIER